MDKFSWKKSKSDIDIPCWKLITSDPEQNKTNKELYVCKAYIPANCFYVNEYGEFSKSYNASFRSEQLFIESIGKFEEYPGIPMYPILPTGVEDIVYNSNKLVKSQEWFMAVKIILKFVLMLYFSATFFKLY